MEKGTVVMKVKENPTEHLTLLYYVLQWRYGDEWEKSLKTRAGIRAFAVLKFLQVSFPC